MSQVGAHEPGWVRIGDCLIERLGAHGVGHVFGVPGDFVMGFFRMLDQDPLTVVNTCDEQGAGFAADAYARIRGLRLAGLRGPGEHRGTARGAGATTCGWWTCSDRPGLRGAHRG